MLVLYLKQFLTQNNHLLIYLTLQRMNVEFTSAKQLRLMKLAFQTLKTPLVLKCKNSELSTTSGLTRIIYQLVNYNSKIEYDRLTIAN